MSQTTQEDPVILPLRLYSEPKPAIGCDVCLALSRQRASARAKGDWSRVSDANVEIARHSH